MHQCRHSADLLCTITINFVYYPPLLFDLISSPQHLNRDLSQNVAFSHPHGSKRFQDFGPKTESALLESMGHTNSTDSDGPNTDSLLLECYGATAAVDLECEIYTTGVLLWNPSAPFSHRRALTRTRRHQRAPRKYPTRFWNWKFPHQGSEFSQKIREISRPGWGGVRRSLVGRARRSERERERERERDQHEQVWRRRRRRLGDPLWDVRP